jgi:predicted DNA-binding antitoxin AbrB/MazE fold protein
MALILILRRMSNRAHMRRALLAGLLMVAVCAAAPAGAQYVGLGTESGYGYGYGPGGGYNGGGYNGGSGRVDLKIQGRKKQRSDKAVKVKVSCGPRACMLDARGSLTSDEGRGKLKPKRDVAIRAGEKRKLKLKLNTKAKRAASDAKKSKVVVKGKAIGSGGGGTDKAKKTIKLV